MFGYCYSGVGKVKVIKEGVKHRINRTEDWYKLSRQERTRRRIRIIEWDCAKIIEIAAGYEHRFNEGRVTYKMKDGFAIPLSEAEKLKYPDFCRILLSSNKKLKSRKVKKLEYIKFKNLIRTADDLNDDSIEADMSSMIPKSVMVDKFEERNLAQDFMQTQGRGIRIQKDE